jgi:uncharacterized protein YcfL
MKTKIKYLVLVLVSFVFVGCCTTHKTEKWEYKQVISPSAEQVAEFGNDGWKLVTVTENNTYILERPKH